MHNFKLGDKVYHKADLAPFEVVGIRKTTVEIQGDWSGGIHNVNQKSWVNHTEIQPYDKTKVKHLSPYLPYKLKGNYEVSEVVPSAKFELRNKGLRTDNIDFFLNYAKPILRPLSDLTKEIEVNGENFYPLELIGKIIDNEYVGLAEDEDGIIIGKDVNPRCGCPYDCDCMSYTYNLFYKDFNFYSTVYQDGNPNDMIDEIVHESYLLMQKLFEWHFDVFGLIEKGLAIDINTLPQSSE